jgi:hypothetical protein
METKSHAKTNAPDSRDENLTCWRAATSPQCLRVETTAEIHIFPYGYFQHAKFSRDKKTDIVEIHFQDTTIIAKGKKLDSLYDALARLAVERIRPVPDKYESVTKNDGQIVEVQITNRKLPSGHSN